MKSPKNIYGTDLFVQIVTCTTIISFYKENLKVLKFLSVAFLALIMLSSCQEEESLSTLEEVENQFKIEEEENLVIRKFKISDEKQLNTAEISILAQTEEALEGISAKNFKLEAIYDEEGFVKSKEGLNVNADEAEPLEIKIDPKEPIENLVRIEVKPIQMHEKALGLSLQLQKEDLSNGRTASLYPPGYRTFLITGPSANRVQINNFTYNPLGVSFWLNSCRNGICTYAHDGRGVFTDYSGYSFTLYKNGWAWYYNCNRQTAAFVDAGTDYYHFRWQWWSRCRP